MYTECKTKVLKTGLWRYFVLNLQMGKIPQLQMVIQLLKKKNFFFLPYSRNSSLAYGLWRMGSVCPKMTLLIIT